MASKGHDRITPDGKKFFKEMEELKKLQVRVGYQQGKTKSKKGVDLLDIAMWNELGTARAPARPFIRQSADQNKSDIEKFCAAQLEKVTEGGTAEQALNAIGVMQKGLIRETISKSKEWTKPNADSTIKKKSKGKGKSKKVGDQPLVDTGLLRRKADYVIITKGGGD